jgi:hypothetical protein
VDSLNALLVIASVFNFLAAFCNLLLLLSGAPLFGESEIGRIKSRTVAIFAWGALEGLLSGFGISGSSVVTTKGGSAFSDNKHVAPGGDHGGGVSQGITRDVSELNVSHSSVSAL